MRKIFITVLHVFIFISSFELIAKNSELELIPRTKFYSSDNVWDVQINSNGSKIAYEAIHENHRTIWISSATSLTKGMPLKVGEGFQFRYFKWSYHPDYLIAFADGNGDERWQLISINVNTGEQNPLSPATGQRALLVGFDKSDHNAVIIAHNLRDSAFNDLYRVNVTSGRSKLIYENTQGYTDFYTDLNGKLKLANKRSDNQSFILQEPFSHKTILQVDFEDTRSFKFLRYSPDGKSFYVLSAQGRDTAALLLVDHQSGETTTLSSFDKADIKEVLFHPLKHHPIAYATDYVYRLWQPLDKSFSNLFHRLSNEFEGRVDVISNSLSGNYYTVYVSGKLASYYAMLDLDSGKVQKLFDAYPQLASYNFTQKIGFKMKTRNGDTQTGTFVAAHGSDGDGDGFPDYPTPMILMAHGGPWDQSRPGFDTWQQWLANRGYSVISPNFRASTGLGKKWLNQGNRQWGGLIQDDIVDAIHWAIKQGYADKDKIASMGASFGGYVSLRLLTDEPELLACGVSTAASPNLISLYEQLPDYWQAFKKEYLYRVGDATTAQGRELLKSHSPQFFAQNIKKPLLIFHGVNDSRVNIAEPRQMVSVMQNNQQPVHFAVSKNTGHGNGDPDSELAYQAIVEQFFAQCLGGKYEPYPFTLPKTFIEFEAGGEFFHSAATLHN